MQILESFGLMASDPGLPVQMFCCSRTFSTETTRKVVFHLLSNRIFQRHFINGKQPRPLVAGMNRIHNLPSSRSDALTTDLLDLHGGRFESTNMVATAKGL